MKHNEVFVPFIGDFFQSDHFAMIHDSYGSFRPLYRGLFSIRNTRGKQIMDIYKVFVPFIGDFFQS